MLKTAEKTYKPGVPGPPFGTRNTLGGVKRRLFTLRGQNGPKGHNPLNPGAIQGYLSLSDTFSQFLHLS